MRPRLVGGEAIHMGKLLWVAPVLITVLAGCLTPASVPGPLGDPSLADVVTLLDKKGFKIDQPVDVFLVGFAPGTGAKLSELLTPEEVAGAPLDFIVNFPPSPDGFANDGLGENLPAVPRAVYRVLELPETFSHDLFEHVLAHPAPTEKTFDANAAEDFLAENVPKLGYAWNASRPAFVILHAHGQLPDGHAWRFTFTNGYLEPVRAFGERFPFLVYDVSARPDPFVTANPQANAYNQPMEAGGDSTAKLLHDLTIDATHYRLLQPAIYAVSTRPCHHVTLLLAIHTTSLTEAADYGRAAQDLVDVPSLQSSFTNLTGDDVTVDLETLMLPQDDPALDAFLRTAGNGAGPAGFVFLDAMRWYLDQNWETYVTPTSGCEEYLSLMIFGDLATRGDFGGIGTYDVTYDRRISFSLWPELSRLRSTYAGPGEDVVRTGARSDDPWNRLNLLYAHETGHLFGQHHPQHLVHAEGESPSIDTFQSVWTVMSYQTGMRLHDFGDIDTANWQRNRAGYTVQKAQLAGLEGTPEFQDALTALQSYRWTDAHLALEPSLPHDAAAGSYHGGESHEHPEYLGLFGG